MTTNNTAAYDSDGCAIIDGVSNVVFRVMHTASGCTAETGSVVVIVDVL